MSLIVTAWLVPIGSLAAGENAIAPNTGAGGPPVPLRLMVCVDGFPPSELSLNTSDPVRGPVVVGTKLIGNQKIVVLYQTTIPSATAKWGYSTKSFRFGNLGQSHHRRRQQLERLYA